jgi:uncharacterized protein YidB (DUF937 family)
MRRATPMGVAMAALLGEGPAELESLAERFTTKGLGELVASWTGPGPGQTVTPRTVRRVLGWRRVDELAELAGLPRGEFLIRLARLLPAAVHRLAMPAPPQPLFRASAIN